jgi:hypothetical protein
MNEENSIPNIWKAQENMIRFYKLLSIGLGVAVALLMVKRMNQTQDVNI